MKHDNVISRRNFIKVTALGFGAFLLNPKKNHNTLTDFPVSDKLGRVCVGKIDLKTKPDESSQTVGVLYEDAVVTWLREVVVCNS